MKDLSEEPQLIQDLWHIINNDSWAWIPFWGPARCGKTTLAMLTMHKIYKNWEDVLEAIVFNLNGFIYKLQKGEPKLFPTTTKPTHMRVPILLIDDFASGCGKAKTRHEKSWDIVKGSWDVLGTRVGVILATMVEPTSPTSQLLLKYTGEVMVTRISDKKRIYKYDSCRREQDYSGWRARQKKDWIEEQTFQEVPLEVYKRYDEMRLSLVDEVFVSITDTMVDDTLDATLKRMSPIDYKFLRAILERGPLNAHTLKKLLGNEGLLSATKCKARGLTISRRAKNKNYYVHDITDFGLEALKANEP